MKIYKRMVSVKNFFKVKQFINSGDRDRKGRFMERRVVMERCDRAGSEYVTSVIMSKHLFVVGKTNDKRTICNTNA